MKVLLTRPYFDSIELAKELEIYGIESHLEPLIEIKQQAFSEDLKQAQALVITSLNGLRCFAAQSSERSLPLFVVGQESMKLASSLGFKRIISGNGTAYSLLPLIEKICLPTQKEIAYITGNYIHTDLILPLTKLGFSAKRFIVYHALESPSLSKETLLLLKNQTISVVVLFSPRSAQIFAKLIKSNKDGCRLLYGVCLSSEIANSVSELKWKGLYIATSPNRHQIIKILRKLKKEGSYE